MAWHGWGQSFVWACSWDASPAAGRRLGFADNAIGQVDLIGGTPWKDFRRAGQPIVWAWLGFVFFRATWKAAYLGLHGLDWVAAGYADMLPLLVVFPLAWLAGLLHAKMGHLKRALPQPWRPKLWHPEPRLPKTPH